MDMRYYSPAGPRKQRCIVCGAVISTNALARSGHERGKQHEAALAARRAKETKRGRR